MQLRVLARKRDSFSWKALLAVILPEDHGDGILLDLDQLKENTVAIVHLATQPPGTLQQVTLRPDKVSRAGFIRLGETQGDEAMCWIHPENVLVMEILGRMVETETGGLPVFTCVPIGTEELAA